MSLSKDANTCKIECRESLPIWHLVYDSPEYKERQYLLVIMIMSTDDYIKKTKINSFNQAIHFLYSNISLDDKIENCQYYKRLVFENFLL